MTHPCAAHAYSHAAEQEVELTKLQWNSQMSTVSFDLYQTHGMSPSTKVAATARRS